MFTLGDGSVAITIKDLEGQHVLGIRSVDDILEVKILVKANGTSVVDIGDTEQYAELGLIQCS